VTGVRYAEVIGDPIAQSKSPIIHKYWLERLKLAGDYRRTFVPKGSLADHLSARRDDPDWLGCNITIPHKENAVTLVDRLDPKAAAIRAVNCVVRVRDGLAGANTDVNGIAAALDGTALEGATSAIIGAGGGARGSRQGAGPAGQAHRGRRAHSGAVLQHRSAAAEVRTLGMASCQAMPDDLLTAVARHAAGTTLFDMVYDPIDTRFLATGRDAGGRGVDGLTMLIGQAAKAFELFFGEAPPPGDAELRGLLVTCRPHSA